MPGQTYQFFSLPSFSFTDGVQTIDQTNATSEFFTFALDSHGTIYNWGFDLLTAAGVIGSCAGNGPATNCVDGSADFGYRYATQWGASVFNNPGHWTAGTVPEPSSVLLLAIGALGLLGNIVPKKE